MLIKGFTNSRKKEFFIYLIIFLISFNSFNHNLFKVANHQWFLNHSEVSDKLISDGLKYAKNNKYKKSSLGRYRNKDNKLINPEKPKEIFSPRLESNKNFVKYQSNYGLQLKFFIFFHQLGFDEKMMGSISSGLMSIVIVLLFHLITKAGGRLLDATLVCISLVFSPWVVVFAKSVYWVPFTWFLPILVTFSKSINSKNKTTKKNSIYDEIPFFLLITFTFLIKLLCGYEYSSSIFLITLLINFFILIKSKSKTKNKRLFRNSITIIFAFFCSLILSFSLHIKNLGYSNLYTGFNNRILPLVNMQRNTNNYNKENIVCNKLEDLEKCKKEVLLKNNFNKINIIDNTIKYSLIPNFIPWVNDIYTTDNEISELQKTKLKYIFLDTKYNLSTINDLYKIFREVNFKIVISTILNRISFPILIIFTIYFCRKKSKDLVFFILFFISPLSWIIIFRGHSLHYNLNYILWYLSVIPFAVYLISRNLNLKIRNK